MGTSTTHSQELQKNSTESRPSDIKGTIYEELDNLREENSTLKAELHMRQYSLDVERKLRAKVKRLQTELNRTKGSLMRSRENNKPAMMLIELQKQEIARLEKCLLKNWHLEE